MAQQARWRSDRAHGILATEILKKHERVTGTPVALPVPIEQIIEVSYGLSFLYDEIDEPAGAMILGALSPADKTIVMNVRHQELFDSVIGPERFTFAHELAHWIYDADDPNQTSLTLDTADPPERFCYDRQAPALSRELRIREVNANKLASQLLLPEHLVRAADLTLVKRDLRGWANRWGVSRQTLQIRLEQLGEFDDGERLSSLFP